MGFSLSHILLVVGVILIIFGAGKLPKMMGDVARGIKAFRDGMKDSDTEHKKITSESDASDSTKDSSKR